MNDVLLSICIPTYNRSKILLQSIDSIVRQKVYQEGNIEIVVSDNASTDNTKELIESLDIMNLHYYRNDVDVTDKNFPLVLNRANGVYRKLSNDTLIYEDGSLQKMINIIKEKVDTKPVMFFLNGNVKMKTESCVDVSMDKFFSKVSYWSTWIGGFGVWAEDISLLSDDIFAGAETKLWQTYVLLKLASKKSACCIYNYKLCNVVPKSFNNFTYSIYQIFYINLPGLLLPYLEKQEISNKTYHQVKRDLITKFFPQYCVFFKMADSNNEMRDNTNLISLLRNESFNEKCFFIFNVVYYYGLLKYFVKKTFYRSSISNRERLVT